VGSLRAYYHLAHLLFLWPRPRGHWYPYHPVAWDDLCVLPFPQLDLLLTAYAEQHPQAGEQEIERLIVAYPAQRMAALRDRRPLRAAGKRVSGHSATLIGAGARPARRDPSQAGTVPGPLVFRAGDPVERSREAFVPRTRVVGQLDRQLTLATGCPALILYGRRRMGKSTVLRNLQGFLPDSVLVAQLSMQEAKAFSAQTSLLTQIAATIADALGDLGPNGCPSPEDTVAFYDYLEACDTSLRAADKRLLLALDEYEYIDRKLGEGVFDEDLLTLIRESI